MKKKARRKPTAVDPIGGNIRRLRLKAGWTQDELAMAARLRPATISDIERGRVEPQLKTLKAIASALAVYWSEFLAHPGG